MKLVVVESPAKAKTINKYLGSDYKVLASYGHIRDLPSKDGSVDPDHDFEAPKSEEPQPPKTSLILPKVPPSVTPTITDLQRKNTNKNRIIMALSIVVFLFILYIIIFWYCSRL